jgi:hypothetical protein
MQRPADFGLRKARTERGDAAFRGFLGRILEGADAHHRAIERERALAPDLRCVFQGAASPAVIARATSDISARSRSATRSRTRGERRRKTDGAAQRQDFLRIELEQLAHARREFPARKNHPGFFPLFPGIEDPAGKLEPQLDPPPPQRLDLAVWNVDPHRKALHPGEKFTIGIARGSEQLPHRPRAPARCLRQPQPPHSGSRAHPSALPFRRFPRGTTRAPEARALPAARSAGARSCAG